MGLTLQNPRGDHQPLDLARPFINFRDARVSVCPLDGIFSAVAVAAVDLNGPVRDSRRHLARKKLRDGCLHAEPCSRVLFPSGLAYQEARRVDLRAHIRQHELNRLKLRNGVAERHALLRIGERRRERSLRNARGLRADTNAPAIKRGEGNLVALALIANAICSGHFAIGRHEFATGRRVDPQLLFFFADVEARRSFLDDQRRYAFLALGRIGVYIDQGRVGNASIGDPRLRAVQYVRVAPAYGPCLQRRRVRAGLRLGEREAADFFSAREGQQESLLLLFVAKTMNGVAVERILPGENRTGGSTAAGNFFNNDRLGHMIKPRAAFGIGKRYTGQSERGRFAKCLVREVPCLIKLFS